MKFEGPISAGDFIDRMSILEIKLEKGLNVSSELEFYNTQKELFETRGLKYYSKILKSINISLWELEDDKRKSVKRYTEEYSDVSTLITQLNDLRYQTKKRIDVYFKSEIAEQKSHEIEFQNEKK